MVPRGEAEWITRRLGQRAGAGQGRVAVPQSTAPPRGLLFLGRRCGECEPLDTGRMDARGPHLRAGRGAGLRERPAGRRQRAQRLVDGDQAPGAAVARRLVQPVRLRRRTGRGADLKGRAPAGMGEAPVRKPEAVADVGWTGCEAGFRLLGFGHEADRTRGAARDRDGRGWRRAEDLLGAETGRRRAGRGRGPVRLHVRRGPRDRRCGRDAAVPGRLRRRGEDAGRCNHDRGSHRRSAVPAGCSGHVGRTKRD